MAEDGRYAVGDDIVVIAEGPGLVSLSLCSPSQRLGDVMPGRESLQSELEKLRAGPRSL
jgi:hypothetical protein